MNELQKLQGQLSDALKKRNYIKASQIQSQINIELRRKESVSLASLLPIMSSEERKKALSLMHKMFVFSDILYGSALEFSEYLKTFDKSIDVEVVNRAKEAANLCRGITRNVDSFKDEEMSEDFGNMCDAIQMMAMNEIYKRQAIILKLSI